jgi:hypothetical protein
MENKVDSKNRRKRIRDLVHATRLEHKQQQKKIDLLCKDMVDAHAIFASKLEQLCFSSTLFEKLISCSKKKQVFDTISKTFSSTFKDMRVSVYLSQSESFEYHSKDIQLPVSEYQLETCFSTELCTSIAQSPSICTIDKMTDMAIQDNLSLLRDIAIVAIPLIKFGPSIGFLLLWRSIEQPLSKMQLEMIASTSSGIARAIASLSVTVTQESS